MTRIFWSALCVVLFACVWSFPARANDVQFAAGAVCDTAEQMAMFGSLYDEKGAEGALAAVNEDAKTPDACLAVQFAYIEVKRGAGVKIGGKNWVVTEIIIVGVHTARGMIQTQPGTFYTLLPAEASPA